uniref:Small ribosomal subunit protein uS3m (Fragments) n=1 Tax=Vanderwaltozyma polyspora (strain ATCC 22028 / DSM 70294 / BCRC 21397 / CBS 2163 / NBRC 10782 / NRRL Y-8283 / UCD 57-17) TaxID=436907 RepID=RMAR_VANPO|nr:RecName: Full=Small ribosomal subunit protein uS3m; AltName: Full=Ribosomal protein VAR1, mitochondrial [Vanderwaltozyma polyspora DSM 70294]
MVFYMYNMMMNLNLLKEMRTNNKLVLNKLVLKNLLYWINKDTFKENMKIYSNYNNNYMNTNLQNKNIKRINNKLYRYMPIQSEWSNKLITKLYITNIKNMNKLLFKNIINNNNNDNFNIINLFNNKYNNNNIMMNLLMFKYLTGWSTQLKGRYTNNMSRTNTTVNKSGTFNNKKYTFIKNNYKLNYISANHNISNLYNVNKNGKYNLKIKLNYI